MEDLTSFVLNSGYVLIHLLENICVPLLSIFSIAWSGHGDRTLIAPPPETFLSYSPLQD